MSTQNDPDTLENPNFILKGRLSAPAHFAEGFTQLSFGNSVAKILFHNVIEHQTAETPELRRAGQYLILPTVQAIELAHLLLQSAKHLQDHVLKGLSASEHAKLQAMLRDFQPGATERNARGEDDILLSELDKNKLN